MRSFSYLTLDNNVRQLRQSDVAAFAAQISGGTLNAADAGYDNARKVWNATVDRRPALIARCFTTSDVQAAVSFAATHRMLLSVRGGGHHIAGNAVADGGLMIDLSSMRAVNINAQTRTARVGPARCWPIWTARRRPMVWPRRSASIPPPALRVSRLAAASVG